jgi:hypothetical protein
MHYKWALFDFKRINLFKSISLILNIVIKGYSLIGANTFKEVAILRIVLTSNLLRSNQELLKTLNENSDIFLLRIVLTSNLLRSNQELLKTLNENSDIFLMYLILYKNNTIWYYFCIIYNNTGLT